MTDEKRRFNRVPFRVRAVMTVNNVSYFSEEIKNLSVGGCLLPIKVNVITGAKCNLKIFLSGTNNELSVLAEGKIIRYESGVVAVKFTEIEPDSLFHLQNIVRYNCPDADKVKQELRNYSGLE
jgi:hypothetical protein